ncbi:hypothetical protein TGARI_239640 [Toxoplasma gondii ARI]|uniref:Transmembrane protein n=1 Tax=Toxoplasma gondii ARI TaxID=1074872 RepID=A0A139XMI4_TOXGO|nr:hypothetical protein TGARI_239640 [Toxoplasma gondii ARI]
MTADKFTNGVTRSDDVPHERQRGAVTGLAEVPVALQTTVTSCPGVHGCLTSLHERADAVIKTDTSREVFTVLSASPFTREECCKILQQNVVLRAKLDAETAEMQEEIERLSNLANALRQIANRELAKSEYRILEGSIVCLTALFFLLLWLM